MQWARFPGIVSIKSDGSSGNGGEQKGIRKAPDIFSPSISTT